MPFNRIKKKLVLNITVDLGSNIRHRAFIADFFRAPLVVSSQCAIFLLMVPSRTHSFSIIAATITLIVIRGILIAKLFCSKSDFNAKTVPNLWNMCMAKDCNATEKKLIKSYLYHKMAFVHLLIFLRNPDVNPSVFKKACSNALNILLLKRKTSYRVDCAHASVT